MAKQNINISSANDGNGDTLRNAFDKTNDNFVELYSGSRESSTITTSGGSLSDSDGFVLFNKSSTPFSNSLANGTIGDTKIVTNTGAATATVTGNFRTNGTTSSSLSIASGYTYILTFDGSRWNVK